MIVLYSSANCSGCKSLKARLDNWNITYETKQIDSDLEAKNKVLDAGFRTVPQLEINGVFVQNLLALSKEDLL